MADTKMLCLLVELKKSIFLKSIEVRSSSTLKVGLFNFRKMEIRFVIIDGQMYLDDICNPHLDSFMKSYIQDCLNEVDPSHSEHNWRLQSDIMCSLTRNDPKEKNHLYIMLDERTGYHKIGRSINPVYREKTLQSDNPMITKVHSCRAPISYEKELHDIFAHKRVRGEWFDLTEDDVEFCITYKMEESTEKWFRRRQDALNSFIKKDRRMKKEHLEFVENSLKKAVRFKANQEAWRKEEAERETTESENQ